MANAWILPMFPGPVGTRIVRSSFPSATDEIGTVSPGIGDEEVPGFVDLGVNYGGGVHAGIIASTGRS